MMPHARRIDHVEKLTRKQITQRAIAARLATESWDDMTKAANSSEQHVRSLARWRKIAAEQNPHLSDSQLDRQAERLRSAYFAGLARRKHQLAQAKQSGEAEQAA